MMRRLAMIANAFPEVSEKFILNQVTGLLDARVDLDVFSALTPGGSVTHRLATEYGLSSRTTYVGVPRPAAARAVRLPGLLASVVTRSPRAALRAFRTDLYATAAANLKNLYFLKSFRGRRYSIVHCQFGPNGLIGAFLKDSGFADALVVTFHGSDINSYPRRHGREVYRHLYERADVVTAGTAFMKAKLLANGCPEEKIRLLPVGFRAEELGLPQAGQRSPRLVLSVGRLHELKGHRYAIEAFATVRQSFPDAHYVIVGEGSLKQELQALARSLGVGDSVQLVGAKPDVEVAELYRRASVLLMPSVRMPDGAEEGQGLVMQEAQACGLPVVASSIGGLPEGLIDGTTGFLVPERDAQALSGRLRVLLEDDVLRARMGTAGRDYVMGRYDVKTLTARLIQIYEGLHH